MSTVLAAVMTPAGLLATALLAVAAAVGTATGAWSGMKTVSADFTAAWGAIVTAIGSGDLAAAWGVVTALTKLKWTRVTTWLGESWAGIQILWNDLTSGLAVKMLGALATIKTAWAAAIGWMKKLWESWAS